MNIQTLISDVYNLVKSRNGWFTDELSSELSREIAIRMQTTFGERKEPPTLRLSKMGEMCPRHLWYSIHHPELAEELPAPAIIKFSYGHTIEAMAIALAKAAGHEVTGEQDELTVDGIKGHRDCVIDGCITDVKSCSSRMFAKFESKAIAYDDPFGYLAQLDGYLVGSRDDDRVRSKDRAYIWAIDKTLGKMVLYEHRLREAFIRNRISSYKQIVGQGTPPGCQCGTVPDGKSGNFKLDTKASYSPYKHTCFPSLRTFLYSDGPRFLTKVVRTPDVPELRGFRTLEEAD
jgi:uncharacterized protein (DUF1810 family)